MSMLTYREAADRVHRSVRTIKRWRRGGMPTLIGTDGRRYVREDVLLKWYRERLGAWPAHQYRMRKIRAEHEHAERSGS